MQRIRMPCHTARFGLCACSAQEIIPQQFQSTCRGERGIIGYISWGLLYFNDLIFQGALCSV